MARDTFILKVDGDLELSDLSEALQLFTDFVQALSSEIAKEMPIQWRIEEVNGGSLTAVIRGEAAEMSDAPERVIRGLGIVAVALATEEPIPYSRRVQEAAFAFTRAIQQSVTALHLTTEEIGNIVLTTPLSAPDKDDEEGLKTHAVGSLEGTVQTLQRRGGFVFTLYDDLLDRAVRCYLLPGQAHLMREAWDSKRVRVTGRIGRDALTGRAIDIRDIWDVKPLPEREPGSYKHALGILEDKNPTPPEVLVRTLRDAE